MTIDGVRRYIAKQLGSATLLRASLEETKVRVEHAAAVKSQRDKIVGYIEALDELERQLDAEEHKRDDGNCYIQLTPVYLPSGKLRFGHWVIDAELTERDRARNEKLGALEQKLRAEAQKLRAEAQK
jgi:hypothetical protein